MTEKAIRLAASLYQTRDGLKHLLGDVYFTQMEEVGALLKRSSDVTGLGILEVAGKLAKAANKDGEARVAVMYLVAAVELLEPSA